MRASRLHRFGRVGPAQLIGASGMRSPGSSLANATPDQGERVTEVIGGVAASEHGSDRTLGLGWAMGAENHHSLAVNQWFSGDVAPGRPRAGKRRIGFRDGTACGHLRPACPKWPDCSTILT